MTPALDDRALIGTLREALLECARAGETVTYNELARRVDFPGPHRIHRLTGLLEVMIREDHAAGQPLLAALAVSRAEHGIPGRGFFHLLVELGRYDGADRGPAAVEQHDREVQSVIAQQLRQGRLPGAL